MSISNEILRAFFVALGAFEICTNLSYVIGNNGMEKARNQHREIPATVTDKQMFRKVIIMLLSGILFLTVGLYSYVTHSFQVYASCIVLILFSIYALFEALYYKFVRTFGMFIISVMLTCFCILVNI